MGAEDGIIGVGVCGMVPVDTILIGVFGAVLLETIVGLHVDKLIVERSRTSTTLSIRA